MNCCNKVKSCLIWAGFIIILVTHITHSAQIYSHCPHQETNLVLDVSEIFAQVFNFTQLVQSKTYKYIRERERQNCSAPLLYIELVSDSRLENRLDVITSVHKVLQGSDPNFNLGVILSFRYLTESLLTSFVLLNFTQTILGMGDTLKAIAFEVEESENACKFRDYFTEYENVMAVVQSRLRGRRDLIQTKLGYVLNFDHLGCPYHNSNLKYSDFVIVDLLLDEKNSLSYGTFRKYLKQAEEATYRHLYSKNLPAELVYHRIRFDFCSPELSPKYGTPLLGSSSRRTRGSASNGASATKKTTKTLRNYYTLHNRFLVEWAREIGLLRVIIANFHDDFKSVYKMTDENSTEVIALLPQVSISNNTKLLEKSEVHLVEDILAAGVSKVYVDTEPIKLSTLCMAVGTTYIGFKAKPFPLEAAKNCSSQSLRFVYRLVYENLHGQYELYPYYRLNMYSSQSQFETELQLETGLGLEGSNFLCSRWLGNREFISRRVLSTIQDCFTHNKTVTHREVLVTLQNTDFYTSEKPVESIVERVLQNLAEVLRVRNTLQNIYSSISIILSHKRLQQVYDDKVDSVRYERLYCTLAAEKLSSYYEAILTWASIHNFKIIIWEHTDGKKYNSPVTWEPLQAIHNKQLDKLMQTFPIYIRRAYNTSKILKNWATGMYPCVPKHNVQPFGFTQRMELSHGFSGAIFNLTFFAYNEQFEMIKAVQTILLLAFNKFPYVEIVGLSEDTFRILINALSDASFQALFRHNIPDNRSVLIDGTKLKEADVKKTLQAVLSSFKTIRIASIKFHCSLDMLQTCHNEVANGIAQGKFYKNLKLGVVITDCIEFAKSLFLESNQFARLNTQSAFNTTYMVCLDQPRVAENRENLKMQDFLDGIFFQRKFFVSLLQGITQVYFRLNLKHSNDTDEIQDFLSFLYDVNFYARNYAVDILLVNCVSTLQATWWHIPNDAAKFSENFSFLEYESDFYKLPQWKPKPVAVSFSQVYETSNTLQKPVNASLVATLASVTVLTVLVVLLGFILNKTRRKRKLLSHAEKLEFVYGRRLDNKSITLPINFPDSLEFSEYNHKKYEISKHDIKIEKKYLIGFGEFGLVYKGTVQIDTFTKSVVAVKLPRDESSKAVVKAMLKEIKLLSYIGSHNNLVEFVGSYTKEVEHGVVWICTEYCSGGTLQNFLRKTKAQGLKLNDFSDLIKFAREIACGMNYICTRNIVHGDLSARNVLLDQHLTCKIADFGLSTKVYDNQNSELSEPKLLDGPLPWRWMAFETLKHGKSSTNSNVWSYGVTLWEIFSLGDLPYDGIIWDETFLSKLENGTRLQKPEHATDDIYSMIESCWMIDLKQRPDFVYILKFFNSMIPYNIVL